MKVGQLVKSKRLIREGRKIAAVENELGMIVGKPMPGQMIVHFLDQDTQVFLEEGLIESQCVIN